MFKLPSLLFGLVTGVAVAPWLQAPQDPGKPATPPPATTPADEGAVKPIPGKPRPHPLEGVYVLRKRVVDRREDPKPSHGWLAVTSRHLFLCLSAPGTDRERPLLRAGVRTWQPLDGTAHDGRVTARIELGWATDNEGGVHLEKPGTEEVRRMQLIQGGVRVMQDDRSWLEFERVE